MHDLDSQTGLVRDLVHGGWKARALSALVRLDVPGLLGDRSMSAAEIARETATSVDGCRRLLRLTAALGILDEDAQGQYRNNAASSLLRRDHPRSMRGEALHVLSEWGRIAWDSLDYSVRSGNSGFEHASGMPVFEYLERHPDEATVFHAFQAAQARRIAASLLAADCLGSTGVIADIGGGSGTIIIELLRQKPGLRGVLHDLPGPLVAARRAAAEAGLEDRLAFVEGSFFDSVPTGADVYLLCHVLHNWPDARARQILAGVSAAMPADASLLMVENLVSEGDDVDLVSRYLDLLMLVGMGGKERSLDEHRALLGDAGLLLDSATPLSSRMSLFLLSACRAVAVSS